MEQRVSEVIKGIPLRLAGFRRLYGDLRRILGSFRRSLRSFWESEERSWNFQGNFRSCLVPWVFLGTTGWFRRVRKGFKDVLDGLQSVT